MNYELIPGHMLGGIRRYIEEGRRPGGFLVALLSNDLMEAVARADEINLPTLHDWMLFLHNEAPTGCYGSPGNFESWMEKGGLNGHNRTLARAVWGDG